MKRHPFDLTSFVFGAVFAGAAAAYLLAAQLSWEVDERWVLPVVLIALGAAGIVGALAGLRSSTDAGDDPTETAPSDLDADRVS